MNSANRIILFFMSIALFACNENLSLNEEDVIKYDYLKPFISSDKVGFKGNHNIDSEDFEFSYEVENTKSVLNEIDERAKKESWNKRNLNANTISYSKEIEIFKSQLSLVVVNIKILENDDRIYFEVK
ncbi:hypothetical protein [Flavobacterium sp.]|uniref:hypothetical protein n=1 Tax=Flavobacterium sp. TaxID=239 RepID=UPI00286D9E96|nr:hypothetical protein [Flavobacterium sp.]